ncbi:MAG: bifunctional riboflavin kinase/FAD synthetase [Pelolinea sp.]|nr:bifunctional riboflavin kinase/FAD synthetase [Pelolinea sp.]
MAGNNTEGKSSKTGAWITIGAFDGVHLGHQELIKRLVDGAKRDNCPSIVVTFFPNPIIHLRNIKEPFYLTVPEEKDKFLSRLGIDSILTISFNQSVSRLSPRDFISMLHQQLKFTCLLIGYDFRLGADRVGGFSTLEELGREMGFCVRTIDPLELGSQPVSSSSIRTAIKNGDIRAANKMLGYPYSIEGQVVHGDGRGKHIGLPTANMSIWDGKFLPGNGVYAAYAILDGNRHPAVVNIGVRPTFYEMPSEQTIEAHILNFSDQIYDVKIAIQFISRLRKENKYGSVSDLMDQVRKDISDTEEVLKNEPAQTNLST